MTAYRKTSSLRSFSAARLILAGCTILLSPGCAWHLGVPPKGEALPSTVKLESSPSIPTSVSLSKLRFKALLLDENGNLFLESGEQIRVHVDVVNTGSSPIQNASASLTGTPSVIEQFPSRTLTIPPLQPGETKSLEFVATLPSSLQPQQVEIRVSVIESGGAAARPQALLFIIQPVRTGADNMDQIPPPVSDFQQPQNSLVSIGAGVYRDRHIASRPYASRDADMAANYFQSFGGVPPSSPFPKRSTPRDSCSVRTSRIEPARARRNIRSNHTFLLPSTDFRDSPCPVTGSPTGPPQSLNKRVVRQIEPNAYVLQPRHANR